MPFLNNPKNSWLNFNCVQTIGRDPSAVRQPRRNQSELAAHNCLAPRETLWTVIFFFFSSRERQFHYAGLLQRKRKTTASNRVQTKKARVQKYRGVLGAGTRTAATSGGDRNNLDFQLFTEQSGKNSMTALTSCLFSRWHHWHTHNKGESVQKLLFRSQYTVPAREAHASGS